MDPQYETLRQRISHDLIQVYLRVGLVVLVVGVCAQIFSPFAPIMLWALVLAVTLYPLHVSLQKRLGGSAAKAATIVVVLGLLLIGVPTVLLGMSLAEHAGDIYRSWQSGTLAIAPPSAGVKEWPLIGERLYAAWNEAAENLPVFLEHYEDPLRTAVKGFMGMTTNTLGTIALFLGALIIAGVMMAYGERGDRTMRRVAVTLVGGTRGESLHNLSVATMRSVATGVIGVAFIQALLLGVGFIIAGIPGAGLLALITVLIGILQLPALLLTIPVLAWLWMIGDGSVVFNSVMSIYIFLAGLSDGVLKPMLLGRGLDVPMPIVLIGALGGMVTLGLIGLFLGAVMLSVGWQLFMAWVDRECEQLTAAAVVDESVNSDSEPQ